jgi:MFS transporter, DHA1 family, tetracycline resistance protein
LNRALFVILGAVLLDAVGIGLIFPILPALLRELTEASDVALFYGAMLALYSLMQFVFAPVLGALSDRFGRRPVLLLSLAGAAVDYVVMALAPNLLILFIGRAIAGLTSANIAVATAYVADISDGEARARRFGYIHAFFGIGFIIGPVLGGVLGDWWVRAPFMAAALLNGLNFLLALFLLPESRSGKASGWDIKTLNPLRPLKWALGFRLILPLLAIYFAINLVSQLYGTVWVLFTEVRFSWTPTMVGLSLAAYGLFSAGAQAFLVGPVTNWLGARRTIILGITAEAIALFALSLATRGWMIFALLPIFALSGIVVPALQSLLSNEVDGDHQGQLQGVLGSLASLSAVFGPLVFSGIYFATENRFDGTVWLAGVAIYAVAVPVLAFVWRRRRA